MLIIFTYRVRLFIDTDIFYIGVVFIAFLVVCLIILEYLCFLEYVVCCMLVVF